MTKNRTIIMATIIMTVAAILVGCNQSKKTSEISTTENTTLGTATVQATNQASVEATVNSTTTAVESTTMKKANQKEKSHPLQRLLPLISLKLQLQQTQNQLPQKRIQLLKSLPQPNLLQSRLLQRKKQPPKRQLRQRLHTGVTKVVHITLIM